MPTPSNPITIDTYFIVTPGSEFISKAYGNLNGADLFFYVSDTHELRVVNFNTNTAGNTTFVLAQNAAWVGVVSAAGRVHVYYADRSGSVWYIPYTIFGATVTAVTLAIHNVLSFSVIFTPQSGPPAFLLLADEGIFHRLYVANDSMFTSPISTTAVYDNAFDQTIFVTRPTIAMHPLDTARITVHTQQIRVSDDFSQTGFYVVQVPGLS